MSSKEHREFFQDLHDRGYLDWHLAVIACNAVANHVANKKTWAGMAHDSYMQALQGMVISIINGKMNKEIEQMDIKELNIQDLKFQEKTSFVSIMQTWQLFIHTPTPNFNAIRQFMETRYKIFDIDAPHDHLFKRDE